MHRVLILSPTRIHNEKVSIDYAEYCGGLYTGSNVPDHVLHIHSTSILQVRGKPSIDLDTGNYRGGLCLDSSARRVLYDASACQCEIHPSVRQAQPEDGCDFPNGGKPLDCRNLYCTCTSFYKIFSITGKKEAPSLIRKDANNKGLAKLKKTALFP